MTVKVKIEGEGELEIPEDSKVSTVVERLDHHLDSVVVISEGKPLPIKEKLEEGMSLKVVPVVSGG
ncbi:MAG: MoaD/ThiS family protein [Thermoplasmata archaeon]